MSTIALFVGASTSSSVLPVNVQCWYPFVLSGLISLQSRGLSSLLQHHSLKASVLQPSALFTVQLSHPYMTTGKIIALTIQTFVGKVMSLLFNTLPRFVIAILPRSRHLLISWLAIIICIDFGGQEIKICHCFHIFPILFALKCYHLHMWGSWYFSEQFWFQLVIHSAQHFTWCTLHIS